MARALDVPLIIGTAGSTGTRPHLEATLAMLCEIAAERELHFRLAVIPADLPKPLLKRAAASGRIKPLPETPELTAEAIEQSTHIVGQMGAEAFRRALAAGADVIVAGRACDTGIFAALPQLLGYESALSTHMRMCLALLRPGRAGPDVCGTGRRRLRAGKHGRRPPRHAAFGCCAQPV